MFFILIAFINLIIAGYISFRLIWPVCRNKTIIIFFMTSILFITQPKLTHGMCHMLNIPVGSVSIFIGIIQVLLFTLFSFTIAIDILYILLNHLKKRPKHKLPLILICTACFGLFGIYQALKVPDINHVTIQSDLLPSTWEPLKIAVLSDLHIATTFEWERKWLQKTIDKTNALKPDIILITGDLIDDTPTVLSHQIAPLLDLQAPGGVYLSFGNHETYRGADLWTKFFQNSPITLLNDTIHPVKLNTNTFQLAGIYQNPHLLDNTPTNAPILLLSHYPSVIHQVPKNKVAVQFSGHTHGGQIWPLHWLVSFMNQGFVKGIYPVGLSTLYVHSGTGLWRGFPIRFLTPSEITFITLIR